MSAESEWQSGLEVPVRSAVRRSGESWLLAVALQVLLCSHPLFLGLLFTASRLRLLVLFQRQGLLPVASQQFEVEILARLLLKFRRLAPEARAEGLPMPAHLWNLVRKESGRCSAYSSGSRYSLWIVGHSYVHWAAERALIRPGGRHLGLGSQGLRVSWWGQRGMRWSQLLLLMERLRSRPRHPDILLIHLGGNDVDSCSGKDLINIVKDDLRVVLDWFPSVLLVWSDIVPRPHCLASRRWTRGLAKLNRQVGKWVMGQGGLQLLHDWVDVSCAGLFHSDGVHLSAVGWDLLLDDFASGCERVLATR
uniref:Uncharacterized protein LOC117359128 n=1 Tax=Geotrypetes seraphini TaxID=260995 RepID=A0A6P8R9E3_GEOSA|nr:uncharacterized protein LOC117359128 [Geotrypetes seraphini]